jgi:hypothetical protein
MLTPISNIISLLFFSRYHGIYSIAISTLFADIVILSIQQFYILKVFNIGFGAVLWHYKFKEMIKNSLSLKIGSQLWDFKDMLATNILSSFTQGTISLYFYSFRIITVIFVITNLPSLQIFSSIISRLASKKDFIGMKILLRKTLIRSIIPFLILLTLSSILLPKIFLLFLKYKFSIEEIKIIYYIFLALIPFYMMLSVELPFVNIIIAMKFSFKIIKINAIFIVVFYICALLLKNTFGIYTIPVALMIAQSQNLIFYVINVRKFFKEALK